MQTFEEVYREDLKFVTDFLSGKNVRPELDDGEEKLPPWSPDCFSFCKDLRVWVNDDFGPFAQFIYFVIFLMVVTLAVDSFDAHEDVTKACYILNVIYIVIFIIELILKLSILGPVAYFRSGFNQLDFALVVLGIVDLSIESALSGTKSLRVVRVFRLARVARIASASKIAKNSNPTPSIDLIRMLEILGQSAPFMLCVFFLLLFFNYLFTLAGMQLFGAFTAYDGDRSRFNYESFNNAFMSTFSMTTGSTGFAIFQEIAFNMRNNAVFLFYIVWQILSRYFLLATIAATLFQRIEDDALNYMKKSARTTMQACYLLERSMMNAWGAMAFRKWRDMMYRASGRHVTGAFVNIKEDGSGKITADDGRITACMNSENSYGIFSPRGPTRIVCAELAESSIFEAITLSVVFASCVIMSIQAEIDFGGRSVSDARANSLYVMEVLVTVYFVLEFFVQSIYRGLWVAPRSYLKVSTLNRLDATATWASVLALLSGSQVVGFIRLLRVCRCLSPVRIVNRIKPLKRVLSAVSESWSAIKNVILIILGMWILFSLIGMQVFGGYFSDCSDPDYPEATEKSGPAPGFPDGCSGRYLDSISGESVKREWRSAYLNFDNFFGALKCTITIFSLDGWTRIYFSAVDSYDIGYSPKTNTSTALAAYFVMLILLSFVTIQMLVGAMYGAFMYLNCTQGGTRISSLKVAFWQIYSTKLRYIEPLSEPARPSAGWRLTVYMLVRHKVYGQGVIAFTILSITIKFLYWGTIAPFHKAPNWVRLVDFIFAVVYFVEWLARYSAFSWRGVTLVWYDKCDTWVTFIVLIYGFLDIIDMQDNMEVWDTLGFETYSALAAFSALRIFRVIPFVPYTHSILKVVRKSMSTLLAMALLTIVVTLAYAIAGVTLFGEYSNDFDVNSDETLLTSETYNAGFSNFKRIVKAMQLLYNIGTGADFAGIMQQAGEATPDRISWVVYIYVLSYLILVKYIISSVCMLVVVYKFTIHATDMNGLAMEAVRDFQEKWQEKDPFSDGEMPMRHYPDFVRSLKRPLGLDPSMSHIEADRYVKKSLLVMGFSNADIVGDTEDLPFDVKFKKALIALHFLVIFGDGFGEDKESKQRRRVARNRIRQFKYGVAAHIVKMRENSGGSSVAESNSGVKDLSILRSLLPKVFEQRLLKSCMHEIYRLRAQVQFKGYTAMADREADMLLKVLREENESASLQNRCMSLQIDQVVDKHKLENARSANYRYLSLLRQLVRQVSEEREKHIMRTWKLETMQLHSKFRVRDPIVRVSVSENGDFLFTASFQKIHVWRKRKATANPATTPLYALCWGTKFSDNLLSLVCTADGKRFFSGHDDGVIRSWQEDTRGKARKVKHSGKFMLLLKMKGHEGPVYDLLMYEGYVLSCSGDSTIRFWRARSEETLQSASLASYLDIPALGYGKGIFCINTFRPILDMNKYQEKDVVTQLIAGTSDGQVAVFVLQTDNAFLFTREWTHSCIASVCENQVSTFNLDPFSPPSGQVAVTAVVCPNRFGDNWELCFAGTSSGQIKIFEFEWRDPKSGAKKEVKSLKPLWTHNVHSMAVISLVPAGGWLFSGSHDMSVVAWREPTVHERGVSQAHEDGYVMHQGRVTSMVATKEMIFSVDDSGVLLVRNSREKNEVKFLDGEGARQISKLSETSRARMVHDLKSAFAQRKTFALQLEDYTKAPQEYADLLVPDVWIDTKSPEVCFQAPKAIEYSLRDESLSPFTFLAQLCRHYFPKREIDKEIPLEVQRWIDSRTALANKSRIRSEAVVAGKDQAAIGAPPPVDPDEQVDPTDLVNRHGADNTEDGDVDTGATIIIEMADQNIKVPFIRNKTLRWAIDEACKSYQNRTGEAIEATELVPKDSMVEWDAETLMKDSTRPDQVLVARDHGNPPRSFRVGTITLDLPFRKIGEDGSDARRQWEAQFKKELAEHMGGVKPSRLQILALEAGSVVVTFKIISEPGNINSKSPTDIFEELTTSVDNGDVSVAGGDVAPGKFADKTRELTIGLEEKEKPAGFFSWLFGGSTQTAEDAAQPEKVEPPADDESVYSDESDEDDIMEGFGDDGGLEKGDDAYDYNNPPGEPLERRHEESRKSNLMEWMGLGGGIRRQTFDDGNVSQSTVASGISVGGGGDHYYDDGADFMDEYNENDVDDIYGAEGGEATEMVDLEAMDARMNALSTWTQQKHDEQRSAKTAEKNAAAIGSRYLSAAGDNGVPKENMRSWVMAKEQGGGNVPASQPQMSATTSLVPPQTANQQSVREWLLFDVALDHNAAEDVEAKLADAGFEALDSLTSPYAVITDRSLQEMGVRKMGHRAMLLSHLDMLRSRMVDPTRSAGMSGVPPTIVEPSVTGGRFTAEYGLAARFVKNIRTTKPPVTTKCPPTTPRKRL